jgi:cyclopropane fatty-acyl-phospholipid synthase-like methyltransferase
MTKVDLCNTSYGHYALDAYGEIWRETYGEDYGQTSWVTTEESNEIPKLLNLSNKSSVLDIGCGSGSYAVHLAKIVGCRILGLDINPEGVRTANTLVEQGNVAAIARFQQFDVSQLLPAQDSRCVL